MLLLAIDPGPVVCGWVLYDTVDMRVIESRKEDLIEDTLAMLRNRRTPDGIHINAVCCEMIASYGMAVGETVFETCVWIGRIVEACAAHGIKVRRIKRQPIKLHLCGSPRAKDANVSQALRDKLGEPGTKKSPGPTYGVSKHAWAALAVAVYAAEVPEA